MMQGIVRRQKGNRDCRALSEAEMGKLGEYERGGGSSKCGKGGRGNREDLVTDVQPLHACANRCNRARTLITEREGVPKGGRDNAHGNQDIPKVKANRPDLDLNLSWSRLLARRCSQDKVL